MVGNISPFDSHLDKHLTGEGSFFKAHVDTPRSGNMFGSLVVFFPTAHEGGSLLMRKNGAEWSFDSSKVLADDGEPRLGYVALYSDVEHEVAVVTSGCRITITYNLYFDHPSSHNLPTPLSSVSAMNNFKDELSSLLIDPEFLPDGGYLGFGLEYSYSLSNCWLKLSNLETRLKGVDADLMQAFKALSVVTSFWSVIDHDNNLFACEDRIPDTDGEGEFGDNGQQFTDWIVEGEGALLPFSDKLAPPENAEKNSPTQRIEHNSPSSSPNDLKMGGLEPEQLLLVNYNDPKTKILDFGMVSSCVIRLI